jgi:predicted hydrocarbon binding protein
MNDQAQIQALRAIPGVLLGSAHRALANHLDAGEAAEILRELGLDAGADIYGLFRNWAADGSDGSSLEDLSTPAFWNRLADFLEALGWGRLDHEQLHPGVLMLSSTTWIEAENAGSGHPGCQFSTGLLAEFLRQVAGQEVAVLEADCRGIDGEACRFLIGNLATLTAVFESMQGGVALAGAVEALG